ncbi:MAG TPA: FAD-dependent monooxygenase [Streptosporangiaceae bacterium]|nr:FAD-dependent monooxygenase [Streptosporangiaceae bacterium]
MRSLRVAVAGAGLGGLALAQGLLRAGADVTVYERDADLATRRQGYRLHLDARAGLALDATLPPESFARFQATSAQPSKRLTVTTERLRVLHEQVGADRGADPYAVRRQYLPAAEPADTGTRCIYGKTPLGPDAPLAARFSDGFTAVVGGRIGMAIGVVRFRTPPQDLGLTPAQDYLMWGRAGDRECFGLPDTELTALDPAGLHALSAGLIRTWHPDLRALHAAAGVDETFVVRVRTSPAVPAWPPSRVTVLGDAIHAMSPARGSGANTALQDAALLCRVLAADGSDVVAAIGDYERQMREYGYAAVAASRQAEAETGARRNRLMFWLYRRLARDAPSARSGSGGAADAV